MCENKQTSYVKAFRSFHGPTDTYRYAYVQTDRQTDRRQKYIHVHTALQGGKLRLLANKQIDNINICTSFLPEHVTLRSGRPICYRKSVCLSSVVCLTVVCNVRTP